MPAKNPVIAVVVPQATHAAVSRLAALQGRSRSAVVRDFLVETTPVLERIAGMLELAYKAEGKWPADLVTKLEAMQSGLELQALGAMESLDVAAADIRQAARSSRGDGRRGTPNPPTTNRGVKPHRTATQQPLDLRKAGRPPAGAETRKRPSRVTRKRPR